MPLNLSPFIRLPVEIRLKIYMMVFFHGPLVALDSTDAQEYPHKCLCRAPNARNILPTNSRIRDEALDAFTKPTHFIDLSSDDDNDMQHHLNLVEQKKSRLEHLCIQIPDLDDMRGIHHLAYRGLRYCKNLKTVGLFLEEGSARWMHLDDESIDRGTLEYLFRYLAWLPQDTTVSLLSDIHATRCHKILERWDRMKKGLGTDFKG